MTAQVCSDLQACNTMGRPALCGCGAWKYLNGAPLRVMTLSQEQQLLGCCGEHSLLEGVACKNQMSTGVTSQMLHRQRDISPDKWQAQACKLTASKGVLAWPNALSSCQQCCLRC